MVAFIVRLAVVVAIGVAGLQLEATSRHGLGKSELWMPNYVILQLVTHTQVYTVSEQNKIKV